MNNHSSLKFYLSNGDECRPGEHEKIIIVKYDNYFANQLQTFFVATQVVTHTPSTTTHITSSSSTSTTGIATAAATLTPPIITVGLGVSVEVSMRVAAVHYLMPRWAEPAGGIR